MCFKSLSQMLNNHEIITRRAKHHQHELIVCLRSKPLQVKRTIPPPCLDNRHHPPPPPRSCVAHGLLTVSGKVQTSGASYPTIGEGGNMHGNVSCVEDYSMVVSLLTDHNLTFSGSRYPAIHVVLPPNLLVFLNRSDIISPFSDRRQLQDFLTIISRNFPQLILKNRAGNHLMLQHEWKVLISTKSTMVYGLSLFNTILIILFIATCTVFFIASVFRFFRLQGNATIRAKKHRQKYQVSYHEVLESITIFIFVTLTKLEVEADGVQIQCYIDSIKALRMSQMETTGRSRQALQQKYIKDVQNLYTLFGIHRQNVLLPNDMLMK
uniref:Plexin_cytopl domain-containing protein n=1 Tax=Elaeophora elaphi TaxID=1147741 RepID=A0A0R3S5W8_9BILA